MDFDAPADAWYVWLGVALASFAIVGVVLSLPSGPPPDANTPANAIDRAAGAPHDTMATYEFSGQVYGVDPNSTVLYVKNEHGTNSASLLYSNNTYVAMEHGGDDRLVNVTHGADVDEAFNVTDGDDPLDVWIDEEYDEYHAEYWQDNDWRGADGQLVVRSFEYNGTRYTFVH